jgi:hypothetical protein
VLSRKFGGLPNGKKIYIEGTEFAEVTEKRGGI